MRRPEAAAMEIGQALGFARRLLSDPARFWLEAQPDKRPQLLRAVYPNGLRFDGERIGTAETSLLFSYLPAGEAQEEMTQEERMASPTGFEPQGKGRKSLKQKRKRR